MLRVVERDGSASEIGFRPGVGVSRSGGESAFEVRTAGLARWLDANSDICRFGLLPLAALLCVTLAFRWSNWDLEISSLFFRGGDGSWPWQDNSLCVWVYRWGILPAWGLAVVGLTTWLVGMVRRRDFAREGLFCCLVLILGPGLLVNGILKPNLHRPRPCQVHELGGRHEFVPVLGVGRPGGGDSYKSFPSGHASRGFCLIAPAFLLRRRSPLQALLFLALGLSIGAAMGTARVAQGRHFASDVIWSAGLVYFLTLLLYYALRLHLPANVHASESDDDKPVIVPFRPRDEGAVPLGPGERRPARKAA